MLRTLALVISLLLLNNSLVVTPPALAADTLIKCKIKGVGIRNFKLEDGIWSDKVWVRKNNTDWKEWCPPWLPSRSISRTSSSKVNFNIDNNKKSNHKRQPEPESNNPNHEYSD